METREISDPVSGLWSRLCVENCDVERDDHVFGFRPGIGHENRQKFMVERSEERRIGSGSPTVLEMISHRVADQFAQVAAGVPGPVAVGGGQIGVDPHSQLLLATRAARPLPRWSAGSGTSACRTSDGLVLTLLRFVRLGIRG